MIAVCFHLHFLKHPKCFEIEIELIVTHCPFWREMLFHFSNPPSSAAAHFCLFSCTGNRFVIASSSNINHITLYVPTFNIEWQRWGLSWREIQFDVAQYWATYILWSLYDLRDEVSLTCAVKSVFFFELQPTVLKTLYRRLI